MGCTPDIYSLYLRLICVVLRVHKSCTQGLTIWYLEFTNCKNKQVLLVVPKVYMVCTHTTYRLYLGFVKSTLG